MDNYYFINKMFDWIVFKKNSDKNENVWLNYFWRLFVSEKNLNDCFF